jgi:valyl-tRNA synthetase
MESRGLLQAVEDREIDLAHSDRSKTPIEPFLADQWFVRMGDPNDGRPGLAQTAMDAVRDGRVRIVPERYAKSYLDWLGEKRDWCISRQLWWGHRIPVWHEPAALAESAAEIEQRRKRVRELAAKHPDRIALQSAGITGSGDKSTSDAHLLCVADRADELETQLDALGYRRDPDVLDTWFSSALWPHSTFGWPEKTPELAYYYPTSALVTSRDIITLWVARMVISGLYNMGDVPFREVYIHPKILDGYGETMSKSKGNGVDPLDVIDKFGADALRFGLAYLTTESQDVRMPVQFECPHCQALIDQTRENRELPRIECPQCRKAFGTQWARDDSLPRGAVVSERFELARNFCNKLWNASRFALLKLGGYEAAVVPDHDLALEDRWILSRLTWATETVTEALAEYRFADAARSMYAFAWDDFCSFYLEVLKGRFQDDAARPTAQRVLAYVLDNLLRLLHPIIPFLTEEVWQLLNQAAPQRGLSRPQAASESIMIAPWPKIEAARRDEPLEQRFTALRSTLTAVNEVRSRQNIPPKKPIEFVVRCDGATAELLSPMADYFQSLANATATAWGPDVTPPPMHASGTLPGIEVLVDLEQHVDVPAEIARNKAQAEKLQALIRGKEKQLADERFVGRAPAQVVERERANLRQAQEQLASVEAALARLTGR